MPIENMQTMFQHELGDIYSAEKRILNVLDELAEETQHDEIADAFRQHKEETEGQIDRLEKVFEQTDGQPAEEECEGIEGLVREREKTREETPDPKVLDVLNTMAAEKTEHYEIAAYANLSMMAERLGMDEAGDLLNENLEEEKQMLDRLERLADEYDYESIAA